jgi:hypothetical protein
MPLGSGNKKAYATENLAALERSGDHSDLQEALRTAIAANSQPAG